MAKLKKGTARTTAMKNGRACQDTDPIADQCVESRARSWRASLGYCQVSLLLLVPSFLPERHASQAMGAVRNAIPLTANSFEKVSECSRCIGPSVKIAFNLATSSGSVELRARNSALDLADDLQAPAIATKVEPYNPYCSQGFSKPS